MPAASGSTSKAFRAASLGLSSAYDQSMRPGWVASTNMNSQSLLGRESEQARMSWMMSMGYGPTPQLVAANSVSSQLCSGSRRTSKSGTCGGAKSTLVECEVTLNTHPAPKTAGVQSCTPTAKRAAMQSHPETPVYQAHKSMTEAETPVHKTLTEKLVMSLSEPSSTPGPSTPAASEASHRVSRSPAETPISASRSTANCPIPRPVSRVEWPPIDAQAAAATGPGVAATTARKRSVSESGRMDSKMESLVRLIETPPSIDLVPLRMKYGMSTRSEVVEAFSE